VCLQYHHVISLILLLRIRLTGRGGICWSELRSVPRPAYDDGGCAGPSLEASQDWHDALEAILDEEYVPEGVNLVQERSNPVQTCLSRPSMEVIRPGPGIPAWPSRNSKNMPARGNKSRPEKKARRGKQQPSRRASYAGPAGEEKRRPGWRPSGPAGIRGPAGGEAGRPARVAGRPGRGEPARLGTPAQPARCCQAQPGEKQVGLPG
jgi:hypothetical protein